MTDVLKIAIERRAQLQDEVAKLDEFIRMAETLMSGTQEIPAMPEALEAKVASQTSSEPTVRTAMRRAQDDAGDGTDVPRPSIIRRSANAAG